MIFTWKRYVRHNCLNERYKLSRTWSNTPMSVTIVLIYFNPIAHQRRERFCNDGMSASSFSNVFRHQISSLENGVLCTHVSDKQWIYAIIPSLWLLHRIIKWKIHKIHTKINLVMTFDFLWIKLTKDLWYQKLEKENKKNRCNNIVRVKVLPSRFHQFEREVKLRKRKTWNDLSEAHNGVAIRLSK